MTKEEHVAWRHEAVKEYSFLRQPTVDDWCVIDGMFEDWDNYSSSRQQDYLDALEDCYFTAIELEDNWWKY